MKDLILASAELNVVYTREGATDQGDRRPRPGGDGQQPQRQRPDEERREPEDGRGAGPGGRDQGRGPGRSNNPVMRVLDADGDGELSAEEFANVSAALLKLDKNGDGKISREELRPEPGREDGPGERGEGGRGDSDRPGAGRGPDDRVNQSRENNPDRRGQVGATADAEPRNPVPGGQTVGIFKNSPNAFPGYTLFAPKHHTLI